MFTITYNFIVKIKSSLCTEYAIHFNPDEINTTTFDRRHELTTIRDE